MTASPRPPSGPPSSTGSLVPERAARRGKIAVIGNFKPWGWGQHPDEAYMADALEIMGEAAARVSPGARDEHPAVPWSEIVGLRNRLIHGYDSVDMDVVWSIIESDLPALVRALCNDPDLRDPL